MLELCLFSPGRYLSRNTTNFFIPGSSSQAGSPYSVVPEHRREIINAIGIAFLRDNPVELRHSLWMPHDGCDLVTPLSKLGKNSRSGIASRTDQRNPHRLPPASELPLVLATSSVATLAKPTQNPAINSMTLRDCGPLHSIVHYVLNVNYDI